MVIKQSASLVKLLMEQITVCMGESNRRKNKAVEMITHQQQHIQIRECV